MRKLFSSGMGTTQLYRWRSIYLYRWELKVVVVETTQYLRWKKSSFAVGSNCSIRSKCFYLIKGRNFYLLTMNICKLVKGGTVATSKRVISIFCDGFNSFKKWECCNLIGGNFHPNKAKVQKKGLLISTFYDGFDGCKGWKYCKFRCGYFHSNKV